jgi:hypothetical protein
MNLFRKAPREDKDEDDDFIIFEFEQTDVEPGEDDELYKINMDKKDD